ncbi:MAG: efflux RND transporter permease subunit [Candidatus Binatia bacterium]|nr:efflux RND transporter permease subunit [Candidatus Binatia bacterium]
MSRAGFNLSALAVRERSVTLFFLLVTAVAGAMAFWSLGRAEDPAFTVRALVVSAVWPGATAQQMQELVADRLEKRIQGVDYFYRVETTARPGRVDMVVEFHDYTPSAKVPDLFYEVRKRMLDESSRLPSGVLGPFVNDEFSDVYFALYSLTAPELAPRQLVREAEKIRDRLNAIPGVEEVHVIGERPERVFVRFDNARLAQLGLSPLQVLDAVEAYNRLVPAGLFEIQGPRLLFRVDADLADLDSVRNVPLRAGGRLITLGDIADVYRGYEDPPSYLVRAFGKDAVLLGVVMRRGENGLELGERLRDFLAHQRELLPLGLHLDEVTNQAHAIAAAVELFQVKFFIAVGVVTLVSLVALGPRAGIVVGIAVPLTLGLTFLLMRLTGINLDRISLGALIVALGLLVDDAIIAIEMMVVKLEEGWERTTAAAYAWTVTAAPMLTGTVVTALGFLPIGFARSGVGEYAGNMFWVLAYALLVSWLVAVVFTPYLGVALLPDYRSERISEDMLYSTPRYQRLRRAVQQCVQHRWTVVLVSLGILLASILVLNVAVPRQFFPTSDRAEVIVDLYLPQGTSIEVTDRVAKRMEAFLAERREVRSLAAYVGAGAPRFFISLNPEMPNSAFAKVVAVTGSAREREAVLAAIRDAVAQGKFPEARVRAHTLLYGPPVQWPVSFRVLGPDLVELRHWAREVRNIVAQNPHVVDPHLEWQERVPVLRWRIDRERLRAIGLTPRDLAQQLQFEFGGFPATELREDIRGVPLFLRGSGDGQVDALQVKTGDGRTVPLTHVGKLEVEFEEPVLKRYNRVPFIAVNAEVQGAQASDVTWQIWQTLEPLRARLPTGYRIDISGTVEQSQKGERSIQAVQPIMLLLMLMVIMLQMRTFRGTLLVVATAPLGIIGAVPALLVAQRPLGFVAMLGLIGLAGILMRNTLILAKQVDDNLEAGLPARDAIVEATVRRVRPVVLTAAAAVLAFIPLATDTFWGPMAIALMGGVTAGTIITLLLLPALYAVWFGVAPSVTAADMPGRGVR